jgi:hypothetical protein
VNVIRDGCERVREERRRPVEVRREEVGEVGGGEGKGRRLRDEVCIWKEDGRERGVRNWLIRVRGMARLLTGERSRQADGDN